MKSSAEWWEEVKRSPEKLHDWLIKQYRGEVTAAARIVQLGEQFNVNRNIQDVLKTIAEQEDNHASWIRVLLHARNVDPGPEDVPSRYWSKTLVDINDFETGSAVAAHAEGMRLERIKVISEDAEAPDDIRKTFKRILRDELFHEQAFREMSTAQALEKTKGNHEAGMAALGLTI